MGRKSKLQRLPPEQRAYVEQLLREDRLTLDEMLAAIRARFPGADTASRSALGRYRRTFGEMTGRLRDIQAASTLLVSELGEDVDDRAGALLAQAVTTLATHAALSANDADADISIKEVGELARAARAVMQARTMSLKERQAIEQAARARLLQEQESNLRETARAQGMDERQVQFWREQVLGIR